MQLIRLGDFRGFNLDMLIDWEVVEPPPPVPTTTPEPSPAPAPEGEESPSLVEEEPSATFGGSPDPTATPPPESVAVPPPLTLTLHLVAGATTRDITLEGPEAEAMRDYLNSRSGALVRAR